MGVGHEREEVACISVGGYFGETALLHDLPTKVPSAFAIQHLSSKALKKAMDYLFSTVCILVDTRVRATINENVPCIKSTSLRDRRSSLIVFFIQIA